MQTIILDRDGVINEEKDGGISCVDEFKLIPKSLDAIVNLKQAGFRVAIATNQSGIGKGLYTEEDLTDIHKNLQTQLKPYNAEIDLICFCPHHPSAGCNCRKPQPGMLEQIFTSFNISDKTGICMVGDSLRDLEVAALCGLQPLLVTTGHGNQTLVELAAHPNLKEKTKVFQNLWSITSNHFKI